MSVAVAMRGRFYQRKEIRELADPAYIQDLVHPPARYSEKNTPLSRGYVPPGGWQQEFLDTLVPHAGSGGAIPRSEPGYTQVDLALRIAGFHGAMAANCHTGSWTRPRFSETHGSFYDWDGPWGPAHLGLPWKPDPVDLEPAALTGIVKEAALFLGASLVGITRINRSWIYQPGWKRYEHEEIELDALIPPSVQYAVVMAIETSYDYVAHAPTARASAAAGLGYSKMALLAPSVAKFIAALGYRAIPCGNDTALSVPLAVDAGLGQLGRLGVLITPEFGPRVRLCKVLTDMPLAPTSPVDFGVTAFCDICLKCAEYCPAQAISHKPRTAEARTVSTSPGLLKWPVHGERCLRFWYRNGSRTGTGMYHVDCYQCVNVCTFNKKPGLPGNLIKWAVRKAPALNRAVYRLDDSWFKPLYRTGRAGGR